MENSITAYVAFCKSFADSHTEIKDFVYGSSKKILNRQRSKIKYPCLWCEVPDADQKESEEDGGMFDGALVILHNYKEGNDQQQLEREESTFQIMQQLVTKLFHMKSEGDVQLLNKSIKIEPIDPWSADNDLGWRIDFQLQTVSGCYEDDVAEGIWIEST